MHSTSQFSCSLRIKKNRIFSAASSEIGNETMAIAVLSGFIKPLSDKPRIHFFTNRPTSRTRFVDHRFPDALGFENQFNGFADRAVAGEGSRDVMRSLFHLGDRIAHGNGEAATVH